MKIYASDKGERRGKLEEAWQALNGKLGSQFEFDPSIQSDGEIRGSSTMMRDPVGISVYHHKGLAIVQANVWDIVVDVLKNEFGYRVYELERDEHFSLNDLDWVGYTKHRLWAGLVKTDHPDIRTNLESLLTPILPSFAGVKQYEFAVYRAGRHEHYEDYKGYDDIFHLPTLPNGLVDFDEIMKKLRKISTEKAIGLSSKVVCDDGTERHIPMIDFAVENAGKAKDMLSRLDLPHKFLVDSGRSFHHYYAGSLMNQEELLRHMERLKEQPEIGVDWPRLQIKKGFGLLRLTPSGDKPDYPEIIHSKEPPQQKLL